MMARLRRCYICRGRIWPWQRFGFYVIAVAGGGRVDSWHPSCR